MAPPVLPEPSLIERTLRAVGVAFASLRKEGHPDRDLFESLSQAEEEIFRKHWPKARPSGNGVPLYDKILQIRVRRLQWRSRLKTLREAMWMVIGAILVLAIAWQQFLQ